MSERFQYTPILESSSGVTDNGKILTQEELIRLLNYQHRRIKELEAQLK